MDVIMLRSELTRTGRQGITREELEPLLAGTPGQDISLLGQLLYWDWGSLANLHYVSVFCGDLLDRLVGI